MDKLLSDIHCKAKVEKEETETSESVTDISQQTQAEAFQDEKNRKKYGRLYGLDKLDELFARPKP